MPLVNSGLKHVRFAFHTAYYTCFIGTYALWICTSYVFSRSICARVAHFSCVFSVKLRSQYSLFMCFLGQAAHPTAFRGYPWDPQKYPGSQNDRKGFKHKKKTLESKPFFTPSTKLGILGVGGGTLPRRGS